MPQLPTGTDCSDGTAGGKRQPWTNTKTLFLTKPPEKAKRKSRFSGIATVLSVGLALCPFSRSRHKSVPVSDNAAPLPPPETLCLAKIREIFEENHFTSRENLVLPPPAGVIPAVPHPRHTDDGCPDADNREQSHLSAFFIIYT
jgi:hypothetical protein